MKIFLAGATGYTGRFLVEAFCVAGFSLRCLIRETSSAEGLAREGVELVVGDLDRPETFVTALEGVDAVVNAAQIRLAPGLIEACKQAGIKRAIFLSSTWRFSRFETPEVRAVVEGEDAVQASGLAATVLRPSMIYGPGEDRNISKLRAYVKRRRVMPVLGSGRQMVQPVYVTDVAKAVVAALQRPETTGRAYEIAGSYPIPYVEMIDTICREVNRKVLNVYVPIPVALVLAMGYAKISNLARITPDQVRRMKEDRAFDISDAQRDLGYTPLSFEEGLREAMRVNGEGGR